VIVQSDWNDGTHLSLWLKRVQFRNQQIFLRVSKMFYELFLSVVWPHSISWYLWRAESTSITS